MTDLHANCVDADAYRQEIDRLRAELAAANADRDWEEAIAALQATLDRISALAPEWEAESVRLYEDAEGDEKVEVEAFTLNSLATAIRAALTPEGKP